MHFAEGSTTIDANHIHEFIVAILIDEPMGDLNKRPIARIRNNFCYRPLSCKIFFDLPYNKCKNCCIINKS